jgi:hypothetical protein
MSLDSKALQPDNPLTPPIGNEQYGFLLYMYECLVIQVVPPGPPQAPKGKVPLTKWILRFKMKHWLF